MYRASAALLLLLASPLCLSAQNLIKNGSFETNGGPNSNVFDQWHIVNELTGNGDWVAQTGMAGPVQPQCGPVDVPAPPDGSFAAMTTQNSQGSHVLYQDVTIPAGATAILSFEYFIHSNADLAAPDSLSYQALGYNQQFRVDVIDPSSNEFTLNVLQNVLTIGDGNPTVSGYDRQMAILAGYGGRTIRIRFIEVDNRGCFWAGVDNVRLDVGGPAPAPAIVRFTANPIPILFAGATTLSWSVQNATSVEIDNGIGSVPLTGSRSVSLQSSTTFTITATSAVGTAQRKVFVQVDTPGPRIFSFSGSPSFIEKGQSAVLQWSTDRATELSIDNGVGAVAASGTLTVTPSATTEYTLTASSPGVISTDKLVSTARATIFIDPGDIPVVSVTSYPSGMLQAAGASDAGVDKFSLTNLGKVATRITLDKSGTFFTQSPSVFDLAAGATQVVTITATTQAAGKYDGASLPTGAGVPDGLAIPVRLFVAVAPAGSVAPTFAVARTEVSAPANENPSGSVSFSNKGTGTLQGILTSDAAWLIPQSNNVAIDAGGTNEVKFTTNRALRPDAASLAGAAVATLTLSYLDFGAGKGLQPLDTTPAHASISVTIVDVVKAGATPASPPPLASNETAFFIAGLTQTPRSSGDILLSIAGDSIADLKLFLGAPGTTSILGSIDQLAPNAGLALPSIMQSIFASNATTGTVQARSASLTRVTLAGVQTNTANTFGSFITALPSFRSDRAANPGDIIYLAGVEKSATSSTTVVVQEVAGFAATARADYLGPSGNVVISRDGLTIGAFSLLSLPDAVPSGAVAVRLTNTSTTGARINAYASVIDAITNDSWTVVDPLLSASAAADVIVPLPEVPSGVSATNELFLLNPGSSALDVSILTQSNNERRRAVRPNALLNAVTIGPGQTLVRTISGAPGFVRITAPRGLAASARAVQTVPGRSGSFGTALPVMAAGTAMTTGDSRRFASVDDASKAKAAALAPATYRSNVGLIETSGQVTVVKLTLRYTFSAGSKTSAQGLSSATVQVPANRLLMVDDIARAVIGPSRDDYGDLRNMQLDVGVVSGGRIIPFLQTIDNGSGDSAIRTQ